MSPLISSVRSELYVANSPNGPYVQLSTTITRQGPPEPAYAAWLKKLHGYRTPHQRTLTRRSRRTARKS